MLTTGQKQYFETFGFLVLRQLFTPEEVDTIRRESDEILLENRQGKPFPGEKRQAMIPFFERSPLLTQFIEDDRIYMLGEDLLGPDFILNATEGNLHVADTAWHGGGPEPEPVPHIKIAFYLEPNTKETGALRVIPGSHKPEFRKRLQPLTEQYSDSTVMPFGVSGADLPSLAIESQPGDVIIFPESLWHASFGGPPGRSQHAINFMANPVTDKQTDYIRGLYESWNYSLHPPEQIVNSDSPRLRQMVAKLVALGFGPPKATPMFV
ncbi:MAG: phytanoyl-CoA dioxygenase family protein [Candidatus Poribacteria bacterium]|nr:phytanoyl-CoA dioxygenase family protein [Candidatus Poribacteria bacterium]